MPYIKISADTSGQKGRFWLTGSQAFQMMKGVSESLAGRAGIVNLLGLSDAEIYGYANEPFTTDPQRLSRRTADIRPRGLKETYARIFRGSMPALYTEPEMDWETYYRSYVNTYLLRDIRDLAQVGDEVGFYHFMTAAAAHTARPVVYEDLAQAAGITSPTARRWLSILISSRLVALVQPYSNNILKRVVRMPLLHFLDTGLAAWLLKWDNPEALERGAMAGAFFESFVFSEIYKSYLNEGKEPPLYYYRDKDQKEIDLLIHQNGTLYPVEIKKNASPGKAVVKNFKVLDPVRTPERFGAADTLKTEIGNGSVICMRNDLLPADERNWYVPAWVI